MFGFNFKMLRQSVEDMRKKLESLQTELSEIERARERIRYAPVSKDDLKGMLSAWVVSSGQKYRQSLQETLTKFARNPRNTPQELVGAMTLSGAAQPFGEVVRPQDVDQALCALFAPLLNKALLDVIETMEWPENAIGKTERAAELARLDERWAELNRDITDLTNAAEEAGVSWSR